MASFEARERSGLDDDYQRIRLVGSFAIMAAGLVIAAGLWLAGAIEGKAIVFVASQAALCIWMIVAAVLGVYWLVKTFRSRGSRDGL